MKIAIIGAGFTGLSAAYCLAKKNHQVYIFEKNSIPGGLALGYKEKNWKWSIEQHYHHLFTNDKHIINLAKEINYEILIKKPKTCVYVNNQIHQLDSPLTVLQFPLLSLINRLRMGLTIAFLKYFPFWKMLEKYNAAGVLIKLMGNKAYEMIWEPLFINKFGKYANNISLAWFWARITKRTTFLAYPKKGFLNFAYALIENIQKNGGKIYYDTEIHKLTENNNVSIEFKNNKQLKRELFDKVIITTPSSTFLKIAPQLPLIYKNKLNKLKGLGATNLLLRLRKPFFQDDTYWLSICDKNAPIMAIVEHTNLIDKINYGGEHLLYLGNYKENTDSYFKMNKQQALNKFDQYLKKINPDYKQNLIGMEFFKAYFAQPIISINYSKLLPDFITPLKNVFLANIEQVYPWDRGTNYAIELGQKIADKITSRQ